MCCAGYLGRLYRCRIACRSIRAHRGLFQPISGNIFRFLLQYSQWCWSSFWHQVYHFYSRWDFCRPAGTNPGQWTHFTDSQITPHLLSGRKSGQCHPKSWNLEHSSDWYQHYHGMYGCFTHNFSLRVAPTIRGISRDISLEAGYGSFTWNRPGQGIPISIETYLCFTWNHS